MACGPTPTCHLLLDSFTALQRCSFFYLLSMVAFMTQWHSKVGVTKTALRFTILLFIDLLH